jgi:hypothetical protein
VLIVHFSPQGIVGDPADPKLQAYDVYIHRLGSQRFSYNYWRDEFKVKYGTEDPDKIATDAFLAKFYKNPLL